MVTMRSIGGGMKNEEVLKPNEVARELNVRIETVYRWCRAGLGTRYGKQFRITREQLDQFAAESAEKSAVA